MNRILTLASNAALTETVYRMELTGETGDIRRPGQFVNIQLDGLYLRRPISVCDVAPGVLTLIYKVVGRGTAQMAQMKPGATLDVLCGLGNGYDLQKCGKRPLLAGGGVGVPPLYGLARALLAQGVRPVAALGFNRAEEIFLKDEFEALGVETHIATLDGSAGTKGFVTDAMAALDFDYVYACGPEPMLRAVYDARDVDGQFSFEQRMACGFGACMGCTCKTKYGNKRICTDGPVLEKGEIIW